jgi:hypothetical protein
MSGGLQTFLRTVDARIGWGRIGVLLSLTIITVAGIMLYRMLREINFEDVVDAVEAVEKHDVVKAAVFVAAGYFNPDAVRPVCPAHDRTARHSLPGRRTGGLHELCEHLIPRRRRGTIFASGSTPQARLEGPRPRCMSMPVWD